MNVEKQKKVSHSDTLWSGRQISREDKDKATRCESIRKLAIDTSQAVALLWERQSKVKTCSDLMGVEAEQKPLEGCIVHKSKAFICTHTHTDSRQTHETEKARCPAQPGVRREERGEGSDVMSEVRESRLNQHTDVRRCTWRPGCCHCKHAVSLWKAISLMFMHLKVL